MLRLAQPWSLLVLLLFVFVFLRLRTFPRGSAWRRGIAWLCLALALTGPDLVVGGAPEAVVFVLDLSGSASRTLADAVTRAETLIRGLPASTAVGVVAFSRSARVVSGLGHRAKAGDHGLSRLATDADAVIPPGEREETDIARGLDLAASVVPAGQGGRVVLLSDGRQTLGDARHAAAALASRGIAVDVVALGELPPGFGDAAVEDVEAPAQVVAGVPFEVRASVRSTVPRTAVVTLADGDVASARQEIHATPGTVPVRFTVVARGRGERRYAVRVSLPGDQEPRNDVAGAVVNVLGPPKILWVGAPPAAGPEALDVTTVGPDGLAPFLARLSGLDAVVLADVPIDALPPGAGEQLRRYVGQDGGGLLMVGGPRSFGLGGYRGTPIEDALPVDLDPASRRTATSLALVLVLDKSGSMGEPFGTRPKIEAARDAAMLTASLLAPGDRLGVLAFDSAPARLVPLEEPAGADALRARLARVEPGGGTRILPAIASAAAMLSAVEGRRHIVLVTDGRGEGGDFEQRARELRARGITLSVVAIGDDADADLLRTLAAAGGGRFEVARDAAKLARLLRREVLLARGPVLHEGLTRVVSSPHPILGTLGGQVPPITAYVSTAPKPLVAVPLRSESGEPIVALGEFGLGRTAAITTDAGGPWSTAWRGWDGAPRLMAHVLRWILRTPGAPQLSIAERRGDDGDALVVRAADADGARLNGRRLAARIESRGRAHAITLEQEGPGRYVGPVSVPLDRPTRVVVEDRSEGSARAAGQGWIRLSYPEEYRVRGVDRALLEEVSRVTGGRVLEDATAPLVLRATRSRVISLTFWLPVVALALLLLELALARGGAARAISRAAAPGR